MRKKHNAKQQNPKRDKAENEIMRQQKHRRNNRTKNQQRYKAKQSRHFAFPYRHWKNVGVSTTSY